MGASPYRLNAPDRSVLFAELCASALVCQPPLNSRGNGFCATAFSVVPSPPEGRSSPTPDNAASTGARSRIVTLSGRFWARRCSARVELAGWMPKPASRRALRCWHVPVLASLPQHRTALGALSRQIVSLFSPDALDLLSTPGSAAIAVTRTRRRWGTSAFRDQAMARRHHITINGNRIWARRGELLLEAALKNGIDLPYDCRAGHCGTCCVRLVSGVVRGGEGSGPGIVHACQCRIVADAVIEKDQVSGVRTVEGVLSSLRPLSPEVMEVGIRAWRALPHHAGQYAQVRFSGYPSRAFSITHPLRGYPNGRSVCFHVRRMNNGRVTASLGRLIRPGHRVTLTGPYGSAHFRANLNGRLILVATNTGFAPIWSIAIAALRESPERKIMIIAGGRSIESLYMGPALAQLAHFPNVLVVPVCSTAQASTTP